jgi:hypothetical protein
MSIGCPRRSIDCFNQSIRKFQLDFSNDRPYDAVVQKFQPAGFTRSAKASGTGASPL